MPPSIHQHLALDEELRTAIRLIRAGLGGLQAINSGNDFYYLPMIALASGFERLMKLVICLRVLKVTGEFPDRGIFKRGAQGHNLEVLLDQILDESFGAAYTSRVPAASADADALRSDPRLREIVRILSRFGEAARYHNLDVILGAQTKTDSPSDEWDHLETAIFTDNFDIEVEVKRDPNLKEPYKRIAKEFAIRLELLARALCRLFTLGNLHEEAKRYTGTIAPFLFLRDDELGTRDYARFVYGDADDA